MPVVERVGRAARRLRAALVVLGLLVAPLVIHAQPAARPARIGWLATSAPGVFDRAFLQGLRELGYVDGRDVTIEWRWAAGDFANLPGAGAELLQLNVNVLIAGGTPAALALQKLTRDIPIVMIAGTDPVQARLVPSLARPGANITGLTRIGPELAGKRLGLLREAFPRVSRVAVLWHDVSNPYTTSQLAELRAAAARLGVLLQPVELRTAADLERAFAVIGEQRAEALVVIQDGLTLAQRPRIVTLAAKSRLPAMYESRDWADAGGLIAYGASDSELYRRAAYFVDKILKGARAADLPVEQPATFELIINVKTAKTLGLTIADNVLLRADQLLQ
jgi:ABC-type uncharacterized transport system substrate-binding protein